jgi:hypothetical protein
LKTKLTEEVVSTITEAWLTPTRIKASTNSSEKVFDVMMFPRRI